MKKLITILSVFLLPAVSLAQDYGFRMMNSFDRGYGYDSFGLGGMMLGMFMIVPLFGIILSICIFIFWVMMLIDAIKHSPEKMKVVWVLVIIFTHVIGALIYYFVEKRPKNKAKTEHTEHNKEEVK